MYYPVNNYTKTGGSLQNWKFFPESKSQSLSTPQIPTKSQQHSILNSNQNHHNSKSTKPHTKNQIKINLKKCRKTGEKCRKTTKKIYKKI